MFYIAALVTLISFALGCYLLANDKIIGAVLSFIITATMGEISYLLLKLSLLSMVGV